MDAILVARVLQERRALRARERWSPAEVIAGRRTALAALRRFASERSRFYARFHRGLEDRPLGELPILTKDELCASFDELVTDPAIHRAGVEAFLAGSDGDERYLGRYWVSRTAGTSGRPAHVLADRAEWSTVIASYARAQEWAEHAAMLPHRSRLAVVSSRLPWPQDARIARSVDSRFRPVRRFDATQPLSEIVAGLQEWQPMKLIAYPSIARVLADEQLAGRLAIQPRAVVCTSEILTPEIALRIQRAWGVRPFDQYAAAETAVIAASCGYHRLHLFEDLVIAEAVDDRGRTVPPGTTGARLLVTMLSSRTMPLIRYELPDRVALTRDACPCGMPFRTLLAIEGRREDRLTVPALGGGTLELDPALFHRVIAPLALREWQIVKEPDGLHVLVVAAASPAGLGRALDEALRVAGADLPPVRVERVLAVPRTELGKTPRVLAAA
jgi:phenylacetate-coenzyme A ligase PaaK-like adenylate-forming protein